MRCSLVLAVVSDDRPGIIEILSKVILDHGGEWTDSKMLVMGGKFAGILLVDLPCRERRPFFDAMDAFKLQGLRVIVEEADQEDEREYYELNLEMVGQDRPGIVREITQLLAKNDIQVESLESRVESASMSGEALFFATALVNVPANVNLELLEGEFEGLANELMVDIKLLDSMPS